MLVSVSEVNWNVDYLTIATKTKQKLSQPTMTHFGWTHFGWGWRHMY